MPGSNPTPAPAPPARKRAPVKAAAAPAPDQGAGPPAAGSWPEDPTTVALLGQLLQTQGTQLLVLESIAKQVDQLAELVATGVAEQVATRDLLERARQLVEAQGPILAQFAAAAPRLLTKLEQLPTTPAGMVKGLLGGGRRHG